MKRETTFQKQAELRKIILTTWPNVMFYIQCVFPPYVYIVILWHLISINHTCLFRAHNHKYKCHYLFIRIFLDKVPDTIFFLSRGFVLNFMLLWLSVYNGFKAPIHKLTNIDKIINIKFLFLDVVSHITHWCCVDK